MSPAVDTSSTSLAPDSNSHDVPLLGFGGDSVSSASPTLGSSLRQQIRRKPVPSSAAYIQPMNIKPVSERDPSPDPSYVSDEYTRLPDDYHHSYLPNRDGSPVGMGDRFRGPYAPIPSNGDPTGKHDKNLIVSPWRSRASRRSYLAVLVAATIVLLAIVIVLHIISQKGNGLTDNSGNRTLFFGWRFVPTIIAVGYGLLVSILLDNVKRTEPYVRLSNPAGAISESTILQTPGPWWSALADGFSKKKNGGTRSWSLICSASCTIIALLVISPLSSVILLPKDVVVSQTINFNSYALHSGQPLAVADDSLDRFQTISHLLQNVTTSAWISDRYFTLPFWPSTMPKAPVDARLTSATETWRYDTLVFQIDLDCTPLHIQSKSFATTSSVEVFSSGGNTTWTNQTWSMVLATDTGCVRGIGAQTGQSDNNLWLTMGGFIWSSPSNDSFESLYQANHSSQCNGSDFFLVSTAWCNDTSRPNPPWRPDLQLIAKTCNSHYYVANTTVSVVTSASGSVVSFDEAAFLAKRQDAGKEWFNVGQFEDVFLSKNWSSFLASYRRTPRPQSEGPGYVLASMNNFSTTDAIKAVDLVKGAIQLKQRFLGESIRSSLLAYGDQNAQQLGIVDTVKSRIIVTNSVAIGMEIALSLCALLLGVLFWLTRTRNQNLTLPADPAHVTTIASLLMGSTQSREDFKVLDNASTEQRSHVLAEKKCWIDSGHLCVGNGIEVRQNLLQESKVPRSEHVVQEWRSFVLKRWTIAALASALLLILVAILVLYRFSRSQGLYAKAFVYEVDIKRLNQNLSNIVPFSIVPTFLAVGIGLWWGALETEFRQLQPFLAMAKTPTELQAGARLSYQSSYLFWAVLRAARHGHWFLSIVCFGAVISQIFTISMSALWTLESGNRTVRTTLSRTLELRTIPNYAIGQYFASISSDNGQSQAAGVIQSLYGDLKVNWLYSATNAMTLNSSDPPWSRDGWSFVPVELSSLQSDQAVLNYQNHQSSTEYNSPILLDDISVTLSTPATKASLRCGEYRGLANLDGWCHPVDLTNSSVWNTTFNPKVEGKFYSVGCDPIPSMYNLASLFNIGSKINLDPVVNVSNPCQSAKLATTLFVHPQRLICCENDVEGQAGNAAIAYWSENWNDFRQANLSIAYHNFTVKWLYGTPVTGFSRAKDPEQYTLPDQHMLWKGVPELTAMNCEPIIEQANATVTIDLRSGRVQSYNLTGAPSLDKYAWADDFVTWRVAKTASLYDNTNYNVTVSHGLMFLTALLRASDIKHVAQDQNDMYLKDEDLSDVTFKFRRPGINMDTMSYSMFVSAGQNMTKLLDPNELYLAASNTFSTYFAHFASLNVSHTTGGWVYQKINDTLPEDLLAAGTLGTIQPKPRPASTTNRTVEVEVNVPVRLLRMSPIAVWLCVGILIWLCLTTIVILLVANKRLGRIIRGTTTIADVGILVAGSDKLLAYLGSGKSGYESDKSVKTKLGWFRDSTGNERWGIELYGPNSGVEWLDKETKKSTKRWWKKGKDQPEYEMVNILPHAVQAGTKVPSKHPGQSAQPAESHQNTNYER